MSPRIPPVLLLLSIGCSVQPGTLFVAGSGSGGSGGSGGQGDPEQDCSPLPLPILYVESPATQNASDNFPAIVIQSRPVQPAEVPAEAAGADRLLEVLEIRNADVGHKLWYRVGLDALAAPVRVGQQVQLSLAYQYGPSAMTLAAAVLRDDRGAPLWVVASADGPGAPPADWLVVQPEGPPLCTSPFCHARRYGARAAIGDEVVDLVPGTSANLGDGIFWLADLWQADGPCPDLPTGNKAYVWASVGICGDIRGDTCQDGFFCSFPPGDCGFADGSGVCLQRPDFCTKELQPVCGCDGKRYGNACEAAASGTSVGVQCEGLFLCGDRFCGSGAEYCQHVVGNGTGGIAGTFSCQPMPDCKRGTGCTCLSGLSCGPACTENAAATPL